MTKPYSLFKKSNGYFYVQFLLPDGSRSQNKSTGKKNRVEAERVAMDWLYTGNVPERVNVADSKKNSIDKIGFFNSLKSYDFNEDEINKILDILKERKFILTAIKPNTKESMKIEELLSTFWIYEKSPYAKDARVAGKSLSVSYFKTCESRVKRYWIPVLKGKYIGEITEDDLKSVIASDAVQNLAYKTVNGIIESITIPLRWAYQEHYTENVCFENIRKKSGKSKEREILSMEQAKALFNADWDNDVAKLANEVAMHTGMRTGEIAALRVKDIQPDGIHVSSSWSRYVGLKCCKNGEEREIPIPISESLRSRLLIQARFNPLYDGQDSFIFFGTNPSKPACTKQWGKYLKRALKEIHHPDPDSICFYSWRHFFCSRMLDQIADKRIVMKLSGHKTSAMIDHYGKHLEDEKTLEVVKNAMTKLFYENEEDSKQNAAHYFVSESI